jgi:hypothetical protein
MHLGLHDAGPQVTSQSLGGVVLLGWWLWQVRLAWYSTRGLGGHLGPDVMKTRVHVVGLDV